MPTKARPAKPKRTRRSPEQAKQHILEAAVRVLSKHGPAASGLKEVAAEAGTSHALITHYFGTYDALVKAAVSEAMAQLRARLINRAMSLPRLTPERMAQLYFDVALEPWYGRLVSWALINDRDGNSELVEQLIPDMKLMAAATEYAIGGDFALGQSRERAEALLVSVWALMIGYVAGNNFFWRALGRKPGPSRDRAVREAVLMLSRGLVK